MTLPRELVEAVRTRSAVLFAGAGLSNNLDLPTWNQLMAEMALKLGYDPEVFAQYGGNLDLAEYYVLVEKTLGELRGQMDRKWHSDESKVDGSPHHQLILELNFPIIYTTNYDRFLEIAYQRKGLPFTKVASIRDFSKIKEGHTQIVKFHGDFDDDKSIVLTESDYFERLAFESPLDIKLRSDSLGRPFLFIGYGIADVNIRYLLYKLHKIWSSSPFADARPHSYILLSKPNPIQEEILRHRGIHPIVAAEDHPGKGLLRFLEELRDAVRG